MWHPINWAVLLVAQPDTPPRSIFEGDWARHRPHPICLVQELWRHIAAHIDRGHLIHTGQASSFGGCMAQVSYFDTARRPVSFLVS